MFEAREQAEAVVLDMQPLGPAMGSHNWEHIKYILEVRPAGQRPFRVEATAKVSVDHHPMTRDPVTVSFDPKSRKTEIHIEGDPRYDPKLISQARKGQADYNRQALLGGPSTPEAQAWSHKLADQAHSHNAEQLAELARARRHPAAAHPEPAHEPEWTVPAVCPECGARVDQSVGTAAMHQACKYCGSPLPLERVE